MISDNLLLSRAVIKKKIFSGSATVGGVVVKDPSFSVNFGDAVTFEGLPVNTDEFIYIMLNKPQGVLSATRDRTKTVLDLLPPNLYRKDLFPVGRLDKDTTGLLIITDDGLLAHRLLSPKHHVEKTYDVQTDKPIPTSLVGEFLKGVEFSDGRKFMPAKLEISGEYTATVTICEGKFHQIKLMFARYGITVTALKRTVFGGVQLDNNLMQGESRLLTENELEILKNQKIDNI
ncbi:MAG: 16S rRNA pseudouridine(516) synthase [Oscillospiraceae bacterium]|nr:16S rRNA pseudouridine(516) synthase [Candidatus Equicaccousia limihippi]